jgi:type I restriction enzyme S subunit
LNVVKEIEATDDEIAELALQRGDVLFNEGGDRDKLGRGWVWNEELPLCIHQNHVFRARLRPETIDPKLLSWYANTGGQTYFVNHGKQTTNLASINLTKLGSLPVPVPPLEEQAHIVAEVDRLLSFENAMVGVIDAGLARATRLRQSILKRAFSGKLVPQDLNDEPADILLGRLRLQRIAQAGNGRRSRPTARAGVEATQLRATATEHPASAPRKRRSPGTRRARGRNR